jgi:hypothetical protein
VQTERRDIGLTRSVIVVCFLVMALAMIAMSVSATAQEGFARLPQLVSNAFKLIPGNI